VRLLLVLAALSGCASLDGRSRRPNILVLMLDDHSADAFGAYGSPLAQTPNLDALAARGTRFERAYCNDPICTPSRQSILTGLYPPATGVTLLSTPLKDGTPTLATHLLSNGYRTGSVGKMHFNSRAKHGFEVRVDTPEYNAWLKDRPRFPGGVRARGPWRPFKDPARIWLNADALPEAKHREETAAAFFVRHGIDFMKACEDGRPFLLWFSLYEPHSPFNFPVEYAGTVDPRALPLPGVGPEDPPDVPLCFRGLSDDDVRGITAAYLQSLAFADEMLGRLLRAVPEDTIIVYLSDHGYHLGHHGRFEKHSFFERAVRAPLLLAGPGLPRGKVSDALVELVDVFPTVCDLAGVPRPAGLHGRPLAGEGRPFVTSFYAHNEEAMIRTREWKLIYGRGVVKRDDNYETDRPSPGRYRKLYHQLDDPEEMIDVSSKHPDVVRTLQARLRRRMQETWPRPLPEGLSDEEALDLMVQPVEGRKP
jgi:choline-sulfatase